MKKILKKVVEHILGKQRTQTVFIKLYKLSLYGMNIGTGASPDASGEKRMLKSIKTQLSNANRLIVFDVGANIGEYSILLDEVFGGDKLKIYCFEPSAKYFKALSHNTSHIQSKELFNIGFGNEVKQVPLYKYSNELLASIYNRRLEHFDIEVQDIEQVELNTVDNFCRVNNISHIHLLKLDVEGHEFKVLEGAREMLSNNRIDFIQFEFGGTNIDSRTFFQDFFYLLKDNYEIYRILKDGLHKIDKYDESLEIFILTNFFAKRKGLPDFKK